MDRRKYPPDWERLSLAIRERCDAPNGQHVRWAPDGGATVSWEPGHGGHTKIVLTVAHLDHDTTHNDEARATRRRRLAAGELFGEK